MRTALDVANPLFVNKVLISKFIDHCERLFTLAFPHGGACVSVNPKTRVTLCEHVSGNSANRNSPIFNEIIRIKISVRQ